MKRTNLLSLLILLSALRAVALPDSLGTDVFGMFVFSPIEFPSIDLTDFNQQLSATGFSIARHSPAKIGLGASIQVNRRTILTATFNATTTQKDYPDHITRVEYRSIGGSYGYDLLKGPMLSLFPYVGLKTGSINYEHRQLATGDLTMNNYLTAAEQYKSVYNSIMHADLGIGFSHQWFYLVALRAGYLLPLEKVRWSVNEGTLNLLDAPDIRYRFYLSLSIGLGNIVADGLPSGFQIPRRGTL